MSPSGAKIKFIPETASYEGKLTQWAGPHVTNGDMWLHAQFIRKYLLMTHAFSIAVGFGCFEKFFVNKHTILSCGDW